MTPRKKRVNISLIGGLGNNLFQISLSRYLEDIGFTVKFDLSMSKDLQFSRFKYFQLEDYVESRVIKISRFLPGPGGSHPILAKMTRIGSGARSCILDLSAAGNLILPDIEFKLLIGYWQRLQYTAKLVEDLRRQVKEENRTVVQVISVHVRRGDMLNTNDVLPDEFYRKAIKQAHETLGPLKIRVITDDPEYCQNILNLGFDFEVFSSKNIDLDFHLLRESSCLVLSRSTFSWWAARLSDAIVFFPSPWDKSTPDSEHLIIPETWIPIRN